MATINRVDKIITGDEVCGLAQDTIIDLPGLGSSDLVAGVHKTSDNVITKTKVLI